MQLAYISLFNTDPHRGIVGDEKNRERKITLRQGHDVMSLVERGVIMATTESMDGNNLNSRSAGQYLLVVTIECAWLSRYVIVVYYWVKMN